MIPGRDWTGWLSRLLLSLQCPVTQQLLGTKVFFLCHAQPCSRVMNRAPSLGVPLLVPWHVGSPPPWGRLWGDADRTQQKPPSLWVILQWNLRFCVSMTARKLAQKEIGHANKHTPNASKQYYQSSQACFSCFYRESPVTTFLFQSHYDSVGTVIFLYCGFQGPKITFSLASLKFIVNINRPK